MKKVFLIASAVSLAFAQAYADVDCTGIVVDENGEPMVGVVVRAQGQTMGVSTDIDGKFKIRVPDNTKTLNFNFIGYKPLEVNARGTMGSITMSPEENVLQDIVVTQSIARTRSTPVALSNVDAAR